MLERVPAAAESTAHFFLRSVEKPVRSSRVLDPRFWRNGADDIDSSAWWPSYLQRVRAIPQTGAPICEEASTLLSPLATRLAQPTFPRHRRDAMSHTPLRSRAQQNAKTLRSYSVSASASQNPKPQLVNEFTDLSDQGGHNDFLVEPHSVKEEQDGPARDGKTNKTRLNKRASRRSGQASHTEASIATLSNGTSKPSGEQFRAFDLTMDAVSDHLDDYSAMYQPLQSERERGNLGSATSGGFVSHISRDSSQPDGAENVTPLTTTTSNMRKRYRASRRKDPSRDTYKSFDLDSLHESPTQDVAGAFDRDTLVQQERQGDRTEVASLPSASAFDLEPDMFGGWQRSNSFALLVPQDEIDDNAAQASSNIPAIEPIKSNETLPDSLEQLAGETVSKPSTKSAQISGESSEQSKNMFQILEPQTQVNRDLARKMAASLETSWNPLAKPSVSPQDRDQPDQSITPQQEPIEVEPVDPKQARFDELLRTKDAATAAQFDEAWTLFLSFSDQESLAPYIFRFLTRSQDDKHRSRALAAFNTIPRSKRSQPMYQAAMQIELARYQYGTAMNLAFEANIRGFNTLPGLFAYLVKNLLWKSVAELLHRNIDARREFAQFAPVPETSATAERRMLPVSELLEECSDMPDLHTKVLSLAERIQDPDFVFMEHHGLLKMLCQHLIIRTVQSPTVLTDITPQALLTILDLGELFDNVSLHKVALDMIFQLPERGDKLNLALTVYRNFRFKKLNQRPNPRIIKELISLCGESEQASTLLYDYLLHQFSPKPDVEAYHQVVVQCARKGDARAAQKYLEMCIRQHGQPERVAFVNPLIYAYAVAGNTTKARQQLDALETDYGLTPDTVSWNMLMLAHVRSENDLAAFDILEEMRNKKLKFNEYTYGQLLAVCAAHGDTEAALDVLVDARDDNVQVSVPMINTVIEAYLKNDKTRAALQFAEAASKSEDKQGLTRLWNSLVRYYAFKGYVAGMMKIRTMMGRYEIPADGMTYAPLMTLLTSRRQTSEAMKLLRKMHDQEKLPVTMLHYSIILNGFVAENNRDAAYLIFNEMKQRFPSISASANAAMLSLQTRRDGGVKLHGPEKDSYHGFKMLAELTKDISSIEGSPFNVLSSRSQQNRVAVSMYFETIIRALIRSGSHDSAAQLMKHVDASMIIGSADKYTSINTSSRGMVLARLDIAIERQDWRGFAKIWKVTFHNAVKLNKSIPTIREGHLVEQEGRGVASLASSAKYSLSAYLNRYMEAMARQSRQKDMRNFFRSKLFPSGFELTGKNWNKYVQVLCRSHSDRDHVRAFKIFETTLRPRSQSWKLLARGMMEKRGTRYLWQPYGQRSRPILQKRRKYRLVKRMDELRLQPGRKIPTYLTAVHLGAVLVRAYQRAQLGRTHQLYEIRARAPRSKRFIQLMPRLKDSIQGSILRGLDDREERKARPRSEESFRERTADAGFMGDQSPLNNLPIEYLEDVEELTGRSNVLRRLLKDNAGGRSQRRQERKDVELGEMFTGQIARTPIMLAGQGRMETAVEMQRRIRKEERLKRQVIETLREDLTARSLAGDISRPILAAEPPPGFEDDQKLDVEAPQGDPTTANVLSLFGGQEAADVVSKSRNSSEGSLGAMPVSQQLDKLAQMREQGNKELKAREERSQPIPPLALPYMERRNLQRRLALGQRKQAQQFLEAFRDQLSSRAHMQRTKAAKRLESLTRAQRRRRATLAYEKDLKAGKRLDPFPQTLRGLERRLAMHGPVRVRFVSDLKRKNKYNYLVRRGEWYDFRKRHLQNVPSKGKYYVNRWDRINQWLALHYPDKAR